MLKNSLMRVVMVLAVAACGLMWAHSAAIAQQPPAVKRTVLLQHDLTIPGFEAVLVQGDLPVGSREGRHTHPGSAMVHVLEGAITLDYEGQPSKTYKVGESFFIEGGKVHEGINKGNVPIKTIITFVIPKGATLTTQVTTTTK